MRGLRDMTQRIPSLSALFFHWKRYLFFCLGWLSFSLGFIGVFLPLLPTVPFMLLAAYLFSKSSPKVYNWLLYRTGFGPMVTQWKEKRAIHTKHKVLTTAILALSLTFVWISPCIFGVKIALSVFFAYLLTFIWKQKTG